MDPCAAMLEKAKEREGVTPVLATAEQFFSGPPQVPFNKVIISGTIHHIANPKAMLSEMAKGLPVGGCCVIVFQQFSPAFLSEPVYMDEQAHITPLQDVGFDVSTDRQCLTYDLSKSHWYAALRRRLFSYLENFTDEQIEEGIDSLEKNNFGGGDRVTIKVECLFVSAWKLM